MKWLLLLIIPILLSTEATFAQRRHKKQTEDRTEQGLVCRLLGALRDKDPRAYVDLFPDIDTFSKVIMLKEDSNSNHYFHMQQLQENASLMLHTDSLLSAQLAARFDSIVRRGDALGLQWSSIIPLRYELVKMRRTRDTLFEKVMPDRFVGYVFFMDYSDRTTWAITFSDMFQMNGAWYGGQIGNLFVAGSVDEYQQKAQKMYRKYGSYQHVSIPQGNYDRDPGDTENVRSYTQVVVPANEVVKKTAQKIILEKKYYTGTFDNEINAQLYIRYLKGDCPDAPCLFEAMYHFGDEDDFVLLTVTKTPDGKWMFNDAANGGGMELTLVDGVYKGSWLTSSSGTGYEVYLKETRATPDKIAKLDGQYERLNANNPTEPED